MSSTYVETRIKDALKASKGNKARASQQLIAWAMQDIKLLQGLTRAHLGGIVAYNVDRVASGRAEVTRSKPAPKPKTAAPITKPATGDGFGKELLKAVASENAAVFGLETYSSPSGTTQTSQRHIDAMSQIVSASKNKLRGF